LAVGIFGAGNRHNLTDRIKTFGQSVFEKVWSMRMSGVTLPVCRVAGKSASFLTV